MIPLGYCQPVQTQAAGLSVESLALVERFDQYLETVRRSPHTRRLYLGAVKRWMAAGGAPAHIDAALLASWLARRRGSVSTATVNLDIKGLRCFYRWRRDWDGIAADQLGNIPKQRKPPDRVVRWLTDAQIGEVLGTCPLDTFVGLRDYSMLLTLYVTGLRAGELMDMDLGDLVERDALFVRGKGGNHRYLPLGEELAGVLDGYLHARAATRPGKRNAFWLRANGKPLRNGRSAWEIVSKRIWQALGLRAGLHRVGRSAKPWAGHYPHELRASFASALLHRGMPLPAISQLMGHADMATTAHYLGVDIEHLRRAAALHPRAHRVGLDCQSGESGSATKPARNRLKSERDSCLQLVAPSAPKRR